MIEENIEETQSNALPIGSKLREYEILSVLGQGGFGITYKARDTHLDKMMVIKEYMPNAFASRSYNSTVTCIPKHKETFEWGLKSFLNEAKTLSKFDHISIVKALNFFEANGTAYFVMDFYEGETLDNYLQRHHEKLFSQEEILSVMMPIIEGLKVVHAEGFLHRDRIYMSFEIFSFVAFIYFICAFTLSKLATKRPPSSRGWSFSKSLTLYPISPFKT